MDKEGIKKERVEYYFNYTYADKGGVKKLLEMVEAHKSTAEMAAHFGLSKTSIAQKIRVLIGMTYSAYLREHGVTRMGVEAGK